MNRDHTRTLWSVGGIVLAGVGGVGVLHLISRSTAVGWIGDGGALGHLSVALYGLGAILYWGIGFGRRSTAGTVGRSLGGFLFILFALIELDPGGWIGVKKVNSVSFYISHGTPWMDKVIVVAVLVAISVLVLSFLLSHRRRFWAGLIQGKAPQVLLALAFVFFLAALVLDEAQGTMTWPHPGWRSYRVDGGAYFAVGTVEEVLELLIPTALLLAVGFGRRSREVGPSRREP